MDTIKSKVEIILNNNIIHIKIILLS